MAVPRPPQNKCISQHSVVIYDMGGSQRIAEVLNVASLRWSRVRDDTSECVFTISLEDCQPQAKLLRDLSRSRYEIVVFRDGERVWEGPWWHMTTDGSQLTVTARDVTAYLSRAVMESEWDSRYPNVESVTGRVGRILAGELQRFEDQPTPINVLPFVVIHPSAEEARTSAYTSAAEMTVWEHLDALAWRSGIDYTTVGRAIHVWDTSVGLGQTPIVTEKDILGPLHVTAYRAELATRTVVTDGEGNWGDAQTDQEYYGLVELLATAYSEEEAELPTTAELTSQAQRNMAGRNPIPLVVRVSDNSELNPEGVLAISLLVPGVRIPLRVQSSIFQINQMQKLDRVTVVEDAQGERVQIITSPAGSDDSLLEEA